MWSRRPIRWRRDLLSYRPQHPRLYVEHGGGEAVAVGQNLAHERERRRPRCSDLADDAAKIEAQLGVKLARQLLHALVVGEAGHVQELEATVARREQRALEQHGTDPVALPWFLDRERHLGFTRHGQSDLPQLRGAAKRLVDEEAMNKRVDAE